MTTTASPTVIEIKPVSSVYGPVKSWRVGASLGVDLLLETSTCSFNCIYCQLGNIQLKTAERKIYVSTEQVEKDFKHSDWQHADIITLSGSGEPTLALNIKEVIHFIKEYSGKPVMVLTNGTLLHDPAVRHDLLEADKVAIKLDSATEAGFTQMNRPVAGLTLEKVIVGAKAFRQEYGVDKPGANKQGVLCLQMMLMPTNVAEAEAMAALAATIQPDEIQLNTPKRPYPLEWALDSRGNHEAASVPARELRVINEDEARALKKLFEEKTGCPVVSVYREEA